MDRDQFQRVKRIFFAARELSGAARQRFLDESCESVEERQAVEAQLELQAPSAFLRTPVMGFPKGRVELHAGDRFDRYEIVRLLGQGGMGAVYQARDLELDRMVALKIIRPDLADQASILQRFKQELLFAQKVTHPNVVRIYDLGVSGEVRFITMEYVEGRELGALLKDNGRMNPSEAVGMIMQVCHGLAAAHAAGIVHRDLKPANIMIDGKGRALIMDFGIAHSMEAALTSRLNSTQTLTGDDQTLIAPQATHAGTLIGTPSYMSPEQAARKRVDQRSDIFTLGLILYTLLTGTNPSTGESVPQALIKRSSEPITPIGEVVPDVPAGLNQIIMKCLDLQPAKRFQSATELAEALHAWVGRSTGTFPVERPIYTRGKFLAIAGGGLAAAGAGIVYFLNRPQPGARAGKIIKVLVNDFANKTGNVLLDGALEPMAALYLEGASFISMFDRNAARRTVTQLNMQAVLNAESGRLLAQREGVGVLIAGVIESSGGVLNLTVEALDAATGKQLASYLETARSFDELPKALNTAIANIRSKLGDVTPVVAQIAAAETFTSRSIEASFHYAKGQEFQWNGDFEQALQHYDMAIDKDPELGRAYAGKGAALANMGRRLEAEEQYRLGLARIDRMSPREKLRTRGSYYLFRRDYERAAEQFRTLSEQYPADTAGIGNLALAHFYQRNMTAAVRHGQQAVELYPNNVLQLNNLMLYQMYAGDFDNAVKGARKVIAQNASYPKAYLGLGLSNLAMGNTAEARDAYGKLSELGPRGASMAAAGLADVAAYEGRFEDAILILQSQLEAEAKSKQAGHRTPNKRIALAQAFLALGRNASATAAVEEAVAVAKEDEVLYLAAIVFQRLGRDFKARSLAGELATRFGPEPQVLTKLVEAEIQLGRNESRAAADTFQSAQKISDTWLGRFGLGRALLALNAFPEAEAQFDVCLQRRGEATAVLLDDEPTYRFFPPVLYYLGRAQQGMASKGAVEQYKAFLKIKEKSQPDPLVLDARKRLAAIA